MEGILPLMIAVGAVSFAVYTRFLDPLANIPGPFLARWTTLWMVYHSMKGDMNTKMVSLHEKYGNLVRTGPNEVSVADPTAIKTIYGAGSKFRKSDWYSVWQGHRKFDLFAERDEKIHGAQRRLVSKIYSMDNLKHLEPSVDTALQLFIKRLSDFGSEPINMSLWAQFFAFDVIGEVTFSRLFGFLKCGKDDGSIIQIDGALKSAAWLGQIPWLYWLHDRLMPVIGNWLGVNARHGSLRAFAASQVEARKCHENNDWDILQMLKRVQTEKPNMMDDTGVLSMVTSNIFAGSDTTAISIVAVLYYLCKNPEAMKKLKEEIKSMEKYVDSKANVWPLQTANQMPYLQACIYEALRLHPAVGMTLPRTTPHEGLRVDGKHIPGGTIVGGNPWVIHRTQDIFGNDANEFKPERWMGEDADQCRRFFFAFGSGARICIGRNLSWIEISKLVPTILQRWEIELVNADATPKQNCWWFVKYKDLYMRLAPAAV